MEYLSILTLLLMSQVSLWQQTSQSTCYAELCNALYERELNILSINETITVNSIQARLKSLSYYINRTTDLMLKVQHKGDTPLSLDIQNASWSLKQQNKIPLAGQVARDVWAWYQKGPLTRGLIVPVLLESRIVIDSIDRIDVSGEQLRFRTNLNGWFDESRVLNNSDVGILLKPNKRVMSAACSGHCWQNDQIQLPVTLSLRELLLSCAINWRNFKNTVSF